MRVSVDLAPTLEIVVIDKGRGGSRRPRVEITCTGRLVFAGRISIGKLRDLVNAAEVVTGGVVRR